MSIPTTPPLSGLALVTAINSDEAAMNALITALSSALSDTSTGHSHTGIDSKKISFANLLNIPKATISAIGLMQVGDNLTVDANGRVSASAGSTYTLPIASSSALGGVKIPSVATSGLSIDGSGNLTVTDLYDQSSATGCAKLPGGLILEWGVSASCNGNNGTVTVTFPLAFNTNYQVYPVPNVSSTSVGAIGVSSCSNTQAVFLNSFSGSTTIRWFAVGR